MPVESAPDVVVIGGGIMGCSAAFFLAQAGARVTLVEKGEQVGMEASGRNAGGIRASGRKPDEAIMAMASIKLWEAFRDEHGGQFEYDQAGQMYLARNDEELAALRRAEPVLRRLGLQVRTVTGPDLKHLEPHLSDMVIGGLHSPADGYANPILATRFVGRLAAQTGVRVLLRTTVTGLVTRAGRITDVQTDRGSIPAGAVVCTAGPWVNEIAGLVGASLPVVPRPTYAAISSPTGPVLRQFVSGNAVYMRPTRAGNILFGGGPVNPADGFDKTSRLEAIRWSAHRAAEVLPALRQTSLLRSWSGTLVFSPDHMIILDRMPGVDNMTFATGCTGHGFCLGPITGKLLSQLTLSLATSLPIDNLRLSRFGPHATAVETGAVRRTGS